MVAFVNYIIFEIWYWIMEQFLHGEFFIAEENDI